MNSYTVATPANLQLGATAVSLRTVTYIKGTSCKDQMLMRFSGMGSMPGNEPFS